jgi:WD40 repeat protein
MLHVADAKRVNDLAILLNSSRHVTAGDDGVKLWNTDNGSLVRDYPGHEGRVLSVALSSDKKQVAAGGSDKMLMIWNLGNARLQQKIITPAEVTKVAYSADNKKLIAAGSDHVIRHFNPIVARPQQADSPVGGALQVMTGHTAAIHALAFAPDSRIALSGAADGSVKMWSVASVGFSEEFQEHKSQIYALCFSPDGKILASASHDKAVLLWNIATTKQPKMISNQRGAVYSIEFSPDGKTLLTGGADKTVRLLSVASGAEIRQFKGPEFPVYSVCFSPNGQMIAAAGFGRGDNRKVFLWNVGNSDPAKVIEGLQDDVRRVQYNPKGNRLLTVGHLGNVNVWDPVSGKLLFSTDLGIKLYSACYSPDGKRIAVTANDHTTHLLDVPAEAQ